MPHHFCSSPIRCACAPADPDWAPDWDSEESRPLKSLSPQPAAEARSATRGQAKREQPTSAPCDWCNTRLAAALAEREPATITRHIREKLLPASKDPISGRWRVRRADVVEVYGLAAQDARRPAMSFKDLIKKEVRGLSDRRTA